MNIEYIKSQLEGYIEVNDAFELKRNNYIKFITLVNGNEIFCDGGEYICMGNNKVSYKNNIKRCNINMYFKDNNGKIFYRTRFFTKEALQMTKKNFDELLDIVESQQKVIDKLCLKLKSYE